MAEVFGDEFDRGAQQTREMSLEVERLNRLGQQFSRTMGRAFRDLAVRGKSFGDVLRGLGEQLAKLALQFKLRRCDVGFHRAQPVLYIGELFLCDPECFDIVHVSGRWLGGRFL